MVSALANKTLLNGARVVVPLLYLPARGSPESRRSAQGRRAARRGVFRGPERIVAPSGDNKPWLSRRGKKIDFARRDAANPLLVQLGEKFAVEIEKRRLLFYGRDDLAVKVEWVAMTCGDGVGFDVL
jgi:hypothetical protein